MLKYGEYKKINDHPEILLAVVFHKWYSIVNAVRIYRSVLPGVYQRWIEIDKIDINVLSPVAYVKFFSELYFYSWSKCLCESKFQIFFFLLLI